MYFLNSLNFYNKALYSTIELEKARSYYNLYKDFKASNLDEIAFLESITIDKD